ADRPGPAGGAVVHEAQHERGGGRNAQGSPRPRGLAPHAYGHDRGPPRGGARLRGQAGVHLQGEVAGAGTASAPMRQARKTTPAPIPTSTAVVATVERCDSHARVVLVSPAKARPTTGITGAPHPITVQPPVASPKTLETAPSAPPRAAQTFAPVRCRR